MTKKIILAQPRGFCAGVRRALDTVEHVLSNTESQVYVFHEIVHNNYLVDHFRKQGVIFVESLDVVPNGSLLIFSAHGVSLEIEQQAAVKKLRVVDATCPLVKKIHYKARNLHSIGKQLILIGHRGHPEIIGTLGQVHGTAWIVENQQDIAGLPQVEPNKTYAYLSQTTLSQNDTKLLASALRDKFPNIIGNDDICYATRNRQEAVKQLCSTCDLILVIGSPSSSNSNRLRETATACGVRSLLIDNPEEITTINLHQHTIIGITAGASAPKLLVNTAITVLREKGWHHIDKHHCAREEAVFPLPRMS